MLYKLVGAGIILTLILAVSVYFFIPRPSDSRPIATPSPTPTPTAAPSPTGTPVDEADDEADDEDDVADDDDEALASDRDDDDIREAETTPADGDDSAGTVPHGGQGEVQLSTQQVVAELERALSSRHPEQPVAVNCPATVPARTGHTFRCTAHADSRSGCQLSTVTVTITDPSGRFRWESVPTHS